MSLLEKEMTRAQFLGETKKVAAYLMTAAALHQVDSVAHALTSPTGIALGEPGKQLIKQSPSDSSNYWEEEEFRRLNSEQAYTRPIPPERISHRTGNTATGIKLTAEAGIYTADFDMFTWKKDYLGVGHGYVTNVLGVPVEYDMEGARLGRIKVGLTDPEEIYEEASKYGVELSGEFKREADGKFSEKHIYRVLDLSEKYNVRTKIHARDKKIVALGREISGQPLNWLNVPETKQDWRELITQIVNGKQVGIVTDEASVRAYAERLRDAFVMVGDATGAKIKSTWHLGVVNSYMTDLLQWERIAQSA